MGETLIDAFRTSLMGHCNGVLSGDTQQNPGQAAGCPKLYKTDSCQPTDPFMLSPLSTSPSSCNHSPRPRTKQGTSLHRILNDYQILSLPSFTTSNILRDKQGFLPLLLLLHNPISRLLRVLSTPKTPN